jgi:hypothetical protein
MADTIGLSSCAVSGETFSGVLLESLPESTACFSWVPAVVGDGVTASFAIFALSQPLLSLVDRMAFVMASVSK